MNTDYTKHTADKLLRDDDFLQSELYPTRENHAFWSRLYAESPSLAKEMDIARLILRSLKKNYGKKSLSPKEVETLWEKIESRNKKHDRRHIRYFRVAASVAALACLVLLAGWYIRFSQQQHETDCLTFAKSFEQQEAVASDQVQLILSDNRQIAINGKETQVDYNEEGHVSINSEQIIKEELENKKIAYNQLIVPLGKRSTITFNDGTRVWINSGSKIIYPVNFDNNKRELYAEGEICIDVAKDEKRPFTVKTNNMEVKALGTTFNVRAYENDLDMQVVLVCGKVEVALNGNKNILSPNQMLLYNNQTNKAFISPVDATDCIAWIDGYYTFKQQQLSAVIHKLSKYYGITFEWDEKLDPLTCSGKLDLKEDLDKVLLILEKTAPVTISKTNENTYRINFKP